MRVTKAGKNRAPGTIDRAALDDALGMAASRCGRLSDEQVAALRRKRRAALALPAAAAFVGVLAMGVRLLPINSTSAPPTLTFATRPGEHGTVTLADGSTIRMNGASRLRVTYTARRRDVKMSAGEAFFDVHHDRTRPFVVAVDGGETQVLGTAFDLDVTHRRVTLAVYRGAVRFAGTGGGVVVRAGQVSRLHGRMVDVPRPFDPSLPDWRQGWIDTEGMQLDELVEVLNRQGSLPISLPAGELAQVSVAGRFRTDHPRELLAAIGESFGFRVVEKSAGLTLEATR